MAIVKAILKTVAGLLLLAVAALFFLARYGSYEQRYKCEGKFTESGVPAAQLVYLKFQLYRPWLFWANSGGAAWSEIPNGDLEYYSRVQRIGDFLHFSTSDFKQTGGISTLSNALWLETRNGRFEGACRQIEPDA